MREVMKNGIYQMINDTETVILTITALGNNTYRAVNSFTDITRKLFRQTITEQVQGVLKTRRPIKRGIFANQKHWQNTTQIGLVICYKKRVLFVRQSQQNKTRAVYKTP